MAQVGTAGEQPEGVCVAEVVDRDVGAHPGGLERALAKGAGLGEPCGWGRAWAGRRTEMLQR